MGARQVARGQLGELVEQGELGGELHTSGLKSNHSKIQTYAGYSARAGQTLVSVSVGVVRRG